MMSTEDKQQMAAQLQEELGGLECPTAVNSHMRFWERPARLTRQTLPSPGAGSAQAKAELCRPHPAPERHLLALMFSFPKCQATFLPLGQTLPG